MILVFFTIISGSYSICVLTSDKAYSVIIGHFRTYLIIIIRNDKAWWFAFHFAIFVQEFLPLGKKEHLPDRKLY